MKRFTVFVLGITIVLVALMRLQLAVTRAFDPDEFAYLHWTWLTLHGYLPYRDFFLYILPGFPWLLSLILSTTGDSIYFLIASRTAIFLIYGLCAGVVYTMTRSITMQSKHENAHTPGVWAALLAVLIFLTFPVTIDKTIDIRPDMVMLFLYFASAWIVFQLQKPARRPASPRGEQGGVKAFEAVASGVLFGASVLIFPKIIFGLPALVYLLYKHKSSILPWLAGAGLVGLGVLGYLGFNTLIPQAIVSITSDAFAVTSGKGGFSPLLLFTPYPLIYLSKGGVSLPWVVNTIVWMLGIAGLFLLLKYHRHHGTFWGLFIAGNILFVVLFPVPYVQYLLPISVAGSVLAAIAISRCVSLFRHSDSNYELGIRNYDKIFLPSLSFIIRNSCLPAGMAYFVLPLLLLSSFFLQYRERVAPGADNREQLQVIGDVLRVTRPDESVYDMVGSFVFRPDGYFICCHPYAEFGQRLASRPGPASPAGRLERELRKSLIGKQTKFLVMDRVGFVFWKSLDPDKAFLLTNYLPMGNPAKPATPLSKLYSLGQTFRCQLGACMQYDMDGKPAAARSTNTFTVIATEKYTVTIEPNGAMATIDNREMDNGQEMELVAGPHGFTTDATVKKFSFQVKRD